MKEITAYGGKWYEVKGDYGYYKAFRSYQDVSFEESEEERIARLAREKAIERDKKIDSILG